MKIPKYKEDGEHVKILQIELNRQIKRGTIKADLLIEDGKFGQKTKKAVQLFQKSKGLSGTGKIGQLTMSHLGIVTDQELGIDSSKGETISSGQDADEGTVPWYERMFSLCKIDPGYDQAVRSDADKLLSFKSRYEKVASAVRIDWFDIGLIHMLEGSFDFSRCLHNGEKIIGTGKKTTMVPSGRGPFATWEDAAIDALSSRVKSLREAKTIGEKLYFIERYNGTGYITGSGRKDTSPYLWARTNVNDDYGKYIYDGTYSSSQTVQKASGFCAVLKYLEESGAVKINYSNVGKKPISEIKPGKITRKTIAEAIISKAKFDVDNQLRETGGKNRGKRIDEINRRAKTYMGAPYCASGGWNNIDDACKELGLENPVPPTASSQAFRKPSFVPSRYIRPEGSFGMVGDAGILQVKSDPNHGHYVVLREDQKSQPEFLTYEYNTDGSGSRDGDGAYAMKRNTIDFSRLNGGKRFVCFTDIPSWVLDHNIKIGKVKG